MIINSSTVGMSAKRDYVYYQQKESVSLMEKAGQVVKLDVSEEAKSLMEQMKEHQLEKKEQQEKKQQENLKKMLEQHKITQPQKLPDAVSDEYDLKIKLLRQMLLALRNVKNGKLPDEELRQIEGRTESKMSMSAFSGVSIAQSVIKGSASGGNSGNSVVPSNVWTKTTVTSAFISEMEHTAFETAGVVKTADGREISFGVSVEMSRAFCAKYESFTQENMILTDPLMINLDSNVANVSDMKFMFDIDADGKEEEVSLAGKDSGFLALDKNGDGKINDGSELFGTKSGDGFADLAVYDEDGNGWIDEADSIFKDLKVWMKAEDGTDVLLDLKKADVGAIYLGNADTEFSLKDMATNDTNGVIRKTGIFLKESGGVGTVQHVDLAV